MNKVSVIEGLDTGINYYSKSCMPGTCLVEKDSNGNRNICRIRDSECSDCSVATDPAKGRCNKGIFTSTEEADANEWCDKTMTPDIMYSKVVSDINEYTKDDFDRFLASCSYQAETDTSEAIKIKNNLNLILTHIYTSIDDLSKTIEENDVIDAIDISENTYEESDQLYASKAEIDILTEEQKKYINYTWIPLLYYSIGSLAILLFIFKTNKQN